MKIQEKYIGSKVFHPILRQFILIEEGKEEIYEKLGLDIFEERKTPKLNVKNTKKRNNNVRGNGNRKRNDK